MKTKIKSVNFHLWEPCNMRCKFCFATFQDVKKTILPKGHLPKEESIQVVKELAQFGFEKITFVGGEPTLCPWLSELILTAKQAGMTTMIVTNGSNLLDEFLKMNVGLLDWITISIDSLNEQTNLKIGRAIIGRKAISIDGYKVLIDRIKKYNYRLKINTVVCSENVSDDLTPIIEYSKPERWKIFQVLPIKGQNDFEFEKFEISQERFKKFIDRHNHLSSLTKIVSESNDDMTGSYAMVDPAGRFFDNSKGAYNYSDLILKEGIQKSYSQINIDFDKFLERGGLYNWEHQLG
jgi:radical S-adenosyl methionine domain-containing protein 2